jgi:uncharacterized protein (DUF924 family)
MAPPSLDASAAILSFWFDGNMQENYRNKWFPTSDSDAQAKTDRLITEQFSLLLNAAEGSELLAWKAQKESFVALILLLDQFSRHIYRHDAGKRASNDVAALALAEEFVHAGFHLQVPVPYFVFALMPFRHSATPDRLEMVLKEIDTRDV